jgi:hypothetical protein
MDAGTAQAQVPANTMHSWFASHNSVEWRIRLRGEIPFFPDVNDEFPVLVLPYELPHPE